LSKVPHTLRFLQNTGMPDLLRLANALAWASLTTNEVQRQPLSRDYRFALNSNRFGVPAGFPLITLLVALLMIQLWTVELAASP